jgi:predicted glycoside hydrolase/deacetylase ChbG (UPF0249 family)
MGDPGNELPKVARTGSDRSFYCRQHSLNSCLSKERRQKARVIINADDVGLSAAIDDSVFRLVQSGAITSVSVLAVGADVESVAKWIAGQEDISVGAHLCLTDGLKPVTEAKGLVDVRGRFPGLSALAARATCGLLSMETIYEEWRAQIDVLKSSGIKVTRLDSHQHVHMLPRIAPAIVRLAKEEGLVVRSTGGPFGFSISACKACASFFPTLLSPGVWKSALLRRYGSRLKSTLDAAGIPTVDAYISPSSLCSRMRHVASEETACMLAGLASVTGGTIEWVVHPSDANDYSGDRAWMRKMRQGDTRMLENDACSNALENMNVSMSTWNEIKSPRCVAKGDRV